MSLYTKNKWLTWLVILLLVANAATLILFWMGRTRHLSAPPAPPPNSDYLVRELRLDTTQQRLLRGLVNEHRRAAEKFRQDIKAGKDSLFELVKQPDAADSTRQSIAASVSQHLMQLDLLTLEHFRQVRALCRPDQQKRFDEIIHEVINRMGPARPQPPGPPPGGPPPPDGQHLPPPGP